MSAIGAVFFVFHGIAFHLTPWSQAIINGIVKYEYPTSGQDETTVVLFREENLRDLKESYPVSYGAHAEVLEALAVHQPRAVLVDFVFIDKRSADEVDHLRAAICDLSKVAAVYLAVPAPTHDHRATGEVDPALLTCATAVSAQMDPVHGVSGVLTYSPGVAYPGRGFLPAPAFAMARQDLKLTPEKEESMEIIWGNGVAPLNREWMGCKSGGGLAQILHMLRHDPMSVKLTCPYTRTIFVGHLLGSSGDREVRGALHKQTVFYGADFQMSGDRVASPVYADLPGVYLHAMAYDNLVSFKGRYKRESHEVPIAWVPGLRFVIPLSFVVDSVLLGFTVSILLLVDEPPAWTNRLLARLARAPAWVRWLALMSAALLVIVGVFVPARVWSVLLGLPLVLAAIAFLHLATPAPDHPNSLTEFLDQSVLTWSLFWMAVCVFLIVDYTLGVEAALLLVALPAYFLYKVVARDTVFVAMALLLVLASLISFYPPISLGPRNVIAYVAFFEVARHLIKHLEKVAAEYFRLRQARRSAGEQGPSERLLHVLDWWFSVCVRGGAKGEKHANTASPTA